MRSAHVSQPRRERIGVYRSIQRRYRPDRHEFERLVAEALTRIPKSFRERMENVAIVVEEEPRAEQSTESLLGLYEGVALPRRGDGYHLTPPDRITLFRRPILASASTREGVIQEIRTTLVHEIGHYFGLDEQELP